MVSMSDIVNRETLIDQFLKRFSAAQEEAGLTPSYLAGTLKKLTKATKTEVFKTADDQVIYSRPLADNATRLRALQMALNIRGIQTTSPQTSLNINSPGEVNFMGAVAKILSERREDVDD